MMLLRDIAVELVGMFLADARLSIGILILVALVAALTESHALAPLLGGGALLIGCLAILVLATWRESRRRS
jgi:hypothetical protein